MERNTKQKDILMNYLKENSDKHISVKEIKEKIGSKVGTTTIYRILNSLVKKNEVKKIPLDEKQGFCYQYNASIKECHSHYHLICEECGKLEHFECKKLQNVIEDAKQDKDFSINENKVVFYGKCSKCKE